MKRLLVLLLIPLFFACTSDYKLKEKYVLTEDDKKVLIEWILEKKKKASTTEEDIKRRCELECLVLAESFDFNKHNRAVLNEYRELKHKYEKLGEESDEIKKLWSDVQCKCDY